MTKSSRSYQKSGFFFRTSILAIFILIVTIASMGHAIFYYSERNFITYHQLMAEANPTLAHKAERTPYTASQLQEKVRKDFFFSKGSDRLHFLVESDAVNLIVEHQAGKTELTEALENVSCYAQQELFFADDKDRRVSKGSPQATPKQKLILFNAERGLFSYDNSFFKAEKIHAAIYEALGHKITSDLRDSLPAIPLLSLDAEEAQYDGKQLAMQGSVFLENAMGSISSEKLLIQPSLNLKEGLFSTILLKNNVVLSLKEHGVLTCQKADFNYDTQKGHFYGSRADPFVVYRNLNQSGMQRRSAPFNLKSLSMDLNVIKNKQTDKLSIHTLVANGDVEINYGDEIALFADQAAYHYGNEGGNEHSFSNLPGKIELTSDKDRVCRIEQFQGNTLIGKTITFDTNQKQLQVFKPRGLFKTTFAAGSRNKSIQPATLALQADHLQWDLSRDILSLRENVEVTHSQLGHFKSDQELKIFYAELNGKRELRAIESDGYSVLCHVQELTHLCHWLICYGKMLVDHEKMIVLLQSPLNAQGKVPKDKQIFYYDHLGEVQADKATIYYQKLAGRLVAKKIILEGNVYLVDHKGMEGDENPKTPLHYALADKVEYNPHTKAMDFSAKDGRRVLFYDKINHLQVSAPELHITRDQQTKKEAIKGVGDVRFHFKNSELEQLLKRSRSL